MTEVTVVAGAQYGSEGKGAIAAHLTRGWGLDDVAIRVAGPNAGHTAYDEDGREWKLRTVPVAAVTSQSHLHIAAGSEIDLDVLFAELRELDEAGHDVTNRLSIHPSATILEPRHINAEQEAGLVGRIGSTGKGIGAARADRIMRRASIAGNAPLGQFVTAHGPQRWDAYDRVLIEGTQGYGLGMHTSFYPQVTSSDCRAIDFLAMTGISPWDGRIGNLRVVLVARVFPIRVAGNSGPLHAETTWTKLGLPVEKTTVTHKVRRVGGWDEALVKEAIEANGGTKSTNLQLALTMLDQLIPEIADKTELDDIELDKVEKHVRQLEWQLGVDINMVGTGPRTVVEL